MNQEILTETLAQLYLRQGNPERALEIYLRILKREPENTEIREAIKKLRREMARRSQLPHADSAQDLTKTEKIRNLERWRENIRTIRAQRRSRGKA